MSAQTLKASDDSDLKDLFKIILRNEDLDGEIKVVLTGTSEKGDGFLSIIKFVEVTGKSSKNENKTYSIALKCGKKELRDIMPIQQTFEREIRMYKSVIPAFQKFLKEKNQPQLDSVAKCYSTVIIEDTEYIALENLKKRNYDLHDRKKHMDKNHYKLTLEAYGRWHAISFALRDQNKELFDKLSNLECIWLLYCDNVKWEFIRPVENKMAECLTENEEFQLLEQFKEKYSPCYEKWYDLLVLDEPQSVITHGDCWNNNFLFHYKPEDQLKQVPTSVVMLDFQQSRLASPVFDLSYHIYTVTPTEDLDNLKELLDIYYHSLAKNIRKLGSDPDLLFPYESLLKHWEKYHLIGLLIAREVMPVAFLNKEDLLDIEDVKQENFTDTWDKTVAKCKEQMTKRTIDLVRHAVTYKL